MKTYQQMLGVVLASMLAGTASAATPAVTFLGPSPYLSFADSPFNGLGLVNFQLEDFEDGALNTLGATTTTPGIVVGPGNPLGDSVDGDDGAIDGNGNAGRSLLTNGFTVFAFQFSAAAPGGLPTHVGIVWTDVGLTTSAPGVGDVVFEAFDGFGNSLGSLVGSGLGDGNVAGGTAEDRFFGAIFAGGIFRIEIAMPTSEDWEVDHLQYGGAAVPLPAGLWLFGAGLVALGARRARSTA